MSPDLDSVITTIGNIPAMPAVAVKVLNLLSSENFDLREIGKTIASDAAMSSRILKTVNSSFYGLRAHVKTIEHAVSMLGEQTIRSLVLMASLESMNRNVDAVQKMLWDDSVGCAVACRIIAAKYDLLHPEEAFMAGLLRHIGKIVMNHSNPKFYHAVVEGASFGGSEPLSELERRYFSYTHHEVGSAILAHWGFSPSLSDVVACHDNAGLLMNTSDDADTKTTAVVVNLGGLICEKLGIGQVAPCEEVGDIVDSDAAKLLNLDVNEIAALEEEILDAFQENRKSLAA